MPLLSVRNYPAANNAYIAAQMRLDEIIAGLQADRKNMTGCRDWADAGSLIHLVNNLGTEAAQLQNFSIPIDL